MDRRDFPAVHLRNIPKCTMSGKCFWLWRWALFQSRWPRPDGYRTGSSQRNTPIPSKKAPQLNVRHGPVPVPSRQAPLPALWLQSPPSRPPQYCFLLLLHNAPTQAHIGGAPHPRPYLSLPHIFFKSGHSKPAADTKSGQIGEKPAS